MSDVQPHKLRRREVLVVLGGLGLGASGVLGRLALGATEADAASCTLAPELTEGPYWIANHLTRRDVTENKPGVPLSLQLTVVDARTCKPIKGADVEIWHADAQGAYSLGRRRFLRGHQRSDADGLVVFHTIYPGWYRGRTPHIHVKVHVGGNTVHTGQLFFPDATSAAVYRTAHYRAHGPADTTNRADGIYAQAGGAKAILNLRRRASGAGYVGRMTLGVKR
jgi:protocatechuate 3,4-dioxygenase beta subunit